MKYTYTWINGLGEKRKKSTLERLRKEAVRDHKNVRLAGEGGVGEAEGSIGQNYGHQAQATIQGYVQNLTGGGGGGGGGTGHGSSHSHSSSSFAPSYGGGGGGFPNIPGMSGQFPNPFGGGSGFGKREGPGDAPSQPGPYASSYAPAMPSYGDGSYRGILPEPSVDKPSIHASPYASSYAPSHPEPSGGGYQPSYDPSPRQYGFSGGTGGYGDSFSSGFGYGGPPEPQPQAKVDEVGSNPWSAQRKDSETPEFPNPQQGYGF